MCFIACLLNVNVSVNVHVCGLLSCCVALCFRVFGDLRSLTHRLLSVAPGDSDGCLLTEYMALTIRVAVETLAASSSRLWVSLLTVSTLMSGLPRVTPRRPGKKHMLGYCQNKLGIFVNSQNKCVLLFSSDLPHLLFAYFLSVVIGGGTAQIKHNIMVETSHRIFNSAIRKSRRNQVQSQNVYQLNGWCSLWLRNEML